MSNKTERTKAYIIEVFFEMMGTIGFDKITVAGLAKEAKINRGTFYLYFSDKYAVLEEVQEEIYCNFEELVNRYVGVSAHEKLAHGPASLEQLFRDACLKLMDFLYERKEVAQLMLGENGDPRFIGRLEKAYIQAVTSKIPGSVTPKEALELEFVFAGAIALAKKWIREGAVQQPEEIAQTLAGCMVSKPIEIFARVEDEVKKRSIS